MKTGVIALLGLAALTPLLAAPALAGAASCPSLSRGMSGANVTAVQQILYNAYQGFPAPTGYFGPTTEAALKQWQGENGIEQTGTVGPKTSAAMKLNCTAAPNPPTPPTTDAVKATLIKSLLAQIKILQDKIAALLAARNSSTSISGGGSSGGASPISTGNAIGGQSISSVTGNDSAGSQPPSSTAVSIAGLYPCTLDSSLLDACVLQ